MKVKEAIARLQEFDPELTLVFSAPDASEYGWEFKASDFKLGDWQEGTFFNEDFLKEYEHEAPYEITAVGIEINSW